MGRLKKRRGQHSKKEQKVSSRTIPVRKKEVAKATLSQHTVKHIRVMPGIIIILIAALLIGLLILAEHFPLIIAKVSRGILFAVAFVRNADAITIAVLGAAIVTLLIAFFLPARRKDKNVKENKLQKSSSNSRHAFGSGWNDFVSKHFTENVKSNHTETRMLFRKKAVRPFQITISSYETGLDALYGEVKKRGKVSVEEVMATFKITKELAEEWANILEAKQLVQIEYPPFGSMLLTMPKEKTEEEQ